jgi:hypothetical protein
MLAVDGNGDQFYGRPLDGDRGVCRFYGWCQRWKVLAILKTHGMNRPAGCSVREIAEAMGGGCAVAEVQKAVGQLEDAGHVYSTLDRDHYAATSLVTT